MGLMKSPDDQAQLASDQRTREVLLFPLNLLASIVDLIFSIPWVGRFLKLVWNSLLTGLHFLFGLGELAAWSLGFRPIKKFKVGVVLLSTQADQPGANVDEVVGALELTAEIFFEKVGIKLCPAYHIPKSVSKHERPNSNWVQVLDFKESNRILNLGCNFRAVFEDLSPTGSRLQFQILKQFFFTAFRRVFGYGAPVTIFMKSLRVSLLMASLPPPRWSAPPG